MATVNSLDGTTIAFDRIGTGPAVVLVGGAIQYRAFDPSSARLAQLLAERFTVFHYDRRGRGASGDTQPYAPEREIEDLAALIEAAGGTAMVFGMSSGCGLVLDAAQRGLGISRIALYEPPFIVNDSRPPLPADYVAHLTALAAGGKRDAAVEYFMVNAAGVPAAYLSGMKQDPSWQGMTAVAHTLAYDGAFVADTMMGRPLPVDRWRNVSVPTLVMDGGASTEWMHSAAAALATLLPRAERRTLEGQDHMVDPEVLARELVRFFQP